MKRSHLALQGLIRSLLGWLLAGLFLLRPYLLVERRSNISQTDLLCLIIYIQHTSSHAHVSQPQPPPPPPADYRDELFNCSYVTRSKQIFSRRFNCSPSTHSPSSLLIEDRARSRLQYTAESWIVWCTTLLPILIGLELGHPTTRQCVA